LKGDKTAKAGLAQKRPLCGGKSNDFRVIFDCSPFVRLLNFRRLLAYEHFVRLENRVCCSVILSSGAERPLEQNQLEHFYFGAATLLGNPIPTIITC